MDGYDYFSDQNQPLVMADYEPQGKRFVNADYQVAERPVQFIPRDRLVQRQTYAQATRLDNPNKPIKMNNGQNTQIIIGFAEGKFE